MNAALRNVGQAVAQKARGEVPGRVRALVAAGAAGTMTAVVTYKLLRSSPSSGDD
jgi:hypothetical protein